jgi:hypothetical protein
LRTTAAWAVRASRRLASRADGGPAPSSTSPSPASDGAHTMDSCEAASSSTARPGQETKHMGPRHPQNSNHTTPHHTTPHHTTPHHTTPHHTTPHHTTPHHPHHTTPHHTTPHHTTPHHATHIGSRRLRGKRDARQPLPHAYLTGRTTFAHAKECSSASTQHHPSTHTRTRTIRGDVENRGGDTRCARCCRWPLHLGAPPAQPTVDREEVVGGYGSSGGEGSGGQGRVPVRGQG